MSVDKITKRELDTNLNSFINDTEAHKVNMHMHITDEERDAWNKNVGIDLATSSKDGLMSKEDKAKMDKLSEYKHPEQSYVPDTYHGLTVDKCGHITKFVEDSDGYLEGNFQNAKKLGGKAYDRYALLNSPHFTGVPSAPTPGIYDENSSQIINQQFAAKFLLSESYVFSKNEPSDRNKIWIQPTDEGIRLKVFDKEDFRWVEYSPKVIIEGTTPPDSTSCIWKDTSATDVLFKTYNSTTYRWEKIDFSGSPYSVGTMPPMDQKFFINEFTNVMSYQDNDGNWVDMNMSFYQGSDSPSNYYIIWVDENNIPYYRNNTSRKWTPFFYNLIEISDTEPEDLNKLWVVKGSSIVKLYFGEWKEYTNVKYYTADNYTANNDQLVYPTASADLNKTFIDLVYETAYIHNTDIEEVDNVPKIISTTQPSLTEYIGFYWINTSTKKIYFNASGESWSELSNCNFTTNTKPVEGTNYSYRYWYVIEYDELYKLNSGWNPLGYTVFSENQPVDLNMMWIDNSTSTPKTYTFEGSWKMISGSIHGKEIFVENGTFTVPDDITTIYVTAIAGGGGGCSMYGHGGGSGYSVYKKKITVTPKKNIAITVGKGGAGCNKEYTSFTAYASINQVDIATFNGADGTNTIVGSYLTLNGGTGAKLSATTISLPGTGMANGECSTLCHATGTYSFNKGGNGASSIFGPGGSGGFFAINSAGTDGTKYRGQDAISFGAGGGGAGIIHNVSDNSYKCSAAGNGGDGLVIIEW